MSRLLLVCCSLLLLAACQGQEPAAPPAATTPAATPGANPHALITTSKGEIEVELYADRTPQTVANFVKLVNDGFYDGLIFHRVIKDFMIQGGGFTAQGQQRNTAPIPFESDPTLTHVDGALSMASTAARVGGSNQFFICDGDRHFLDGNYAVFGRVVRGLDVVRAIASAPKANRGGPFTDLPEPTISIVSVRMK